VSRRPDPAALAAALAGALALLAAGGAGAQAPAGAVSVEGERRPSAGPGRSQKPAGSVSVQDEPAPPVPPVTRPPAEPGGPGGPVPVGPDAARLIGAIGLIGHATGSVALALEELEAGDRHDREGRPEQALEAYGRALAELQRAGHGAEPALRADVLTRVADLQRRQQAYGPALEAYQQALGLYRGIGDPAGEAASLNSIGGVLQLQGRLAEAMRHYLESLPLRRQLDDRRGEARTLINLAACHFELGSYARALESYQAALAALAPLGEAGAAERGSVLNNAGLVHAALGEYPRALELYEQALAVRRQAGDEPGLATTLHNVGFAYHELRRREQARARYGEALALRRGLGDRLGVAETLNNLGALQGELGERAQALASLEEALGVFQALGSLAGEARTLDSLGTVYRDAGEHAWAVDLYQRSLAALRAVGDRPAERITLANLGLAFERQGQPELAIVFYKQAVNVSEALRRELQVLPMAQQRAYAETVAETYRHLADLLLQRDRVLEAQQVLDLLKVQEVEGYLGSVRGAPGPAEGLPDLPPERTIREGYEALQGQAVALGRELAELRRVPEPDRPPEQTRRIAEIARLQAELMGQFAAFLRSPAITALLEQLGRTAREQSLSLTQLRGLADNLRRLPGAVLLYPLILDDRLELVLATTDAPPIRRTVPVGREALNRAVLGFRRALQARAPEVAALARELYGWLVAPVAPDIAQAGAGTLLYAPDGALRYVPLAALHDGERWLAERFRVNNITALSLADLETRPARAPRVLAGAFTRGSFAFRVAEQTFRLDGLRFARQEVDDLAAAVPQSTRLLDEQFSTASVVPRMNEFSIVHLATHAALVPGRPEDSFILFGSGERLTPRDIESWFLTEVDLVVLSACETGLGSTLGNGEEILGFGYLVEQAGARAAMASLWAVDDGGTQALMTAFYQALQREGTTKAEALRQAQLALIAAPEGGAGASPRGVPLDLAQRARRSAPAEVAGHLGHPYYWAPFLLIGNGL
jgi:CHAT domain-containing protein/tetratricopeptide (TPR) repeat protein